MDRSASLFLLWSAHRAPHPFCLCADTRRYTAALCLLPRCRRCGGALPAVRRGRARALGDDPELCFRCRHDARWPVTPRLGS